MKTRKILAVILSVMLILTLIPVTSLAADKSPSGEEYVEYLEAFYESSIKERSKYCADVWSEIQQVYQEGRVYYGKLGNGIFYEDDENLPLTDYTTLLTGLGDLTWVKSKKELPDVKQRYLDKIQAEYKSHPKSDYNEENWDIIQDYLYIGKKQLNSAKTFRDAVDGYSYVMLGMDIAVDNDYVQEFREESISELHTYVYLYLNPDSYSKTDWDNIQRTYKEAVKKIKGAALESEITELVTKYGEKIAKLAGDVYPMDEDAYESLMQELIQPAEAYYDSMSQDMYSVERQEQALDLIWDLEDDIYEAESRAEASKMVEKVVAKLKALPTKADDRKMIQTFVPKVSTKAVNDSTIQISWSTNKELDGYVVYRADKKDSQYKQVGQVNGGSKKSFSDKKRAFGKTYYYKVKGVKSIDFRNSYTQFSKAVAGKTKLVAPVLTLSKTGKRSVQLKWKAVTNAKGYEIYRSNSVNGAFKKVTTIKNGKTASWKDTSTKKGRTYCYKIRSFGKSNGKVVYSSYSTIKKIKR